MLHDDTDDCRSAGPEGDAAAGEDERRERASTRRSFLRDVGRKAAYLTPVVMTLAAKEVRAGSGFRSTCRDVGSPCTAVVDPCCTGLICDDLGSSGMNKCR